MAVPFFSCPLVQRGNGSFLLSGAGGGRCAPAKLGFLFCSHGAGEALLSLSRESNQRAPGVAKLPCFIATPDPSPYDLCGAETGTRIATPSRGVRRQFAHFPARLYRPAGPVIPPTLAGASSSLTALCSGSFELVVGPEESRVTSVDARSAVAASCPL